MCKPTQMITSSSGRQRSDTGLAGLKSKYLQGYAPFQRLLSRGDFLAHLNCWQNLVPCGCGNEILPSWLAIS